MLRVLLIIIAVFFSSPQKILAAQDSTKKIDIESLGLDNVDEKKSSETKIETKNLESSQALEPEAQKAKEVLTKIQTKVQDLVSKKIAPLIKNKKNQPSAKLPTEQKKPAKEIAKKSLPKKKKAQKKVKKVSEISYEKMQKQLEELREKYLKKAEKYSDLEVQNSDEDFLQDGEIAVPQKKNLNPFIIDEAPAAPVLSRYRTSDNLHVPLVMTMHEKIETLFSAIASGIIENFNAAYKNVENPNIKNSQGDTLLTYAILLQRYPMIAAIIANGADLEMPNALGYNPATIAIEMRDFKTFEILIKNNLNLTYRDIFGQNYLMYAARAGFLPAAEALVSRGVDVNEMSNDGATALTFAYRYKQEVVAKFLLKSGAKSWIEKPYEPDEQSLIKDLEKRWK